MTLFDLIKQWLAEQTEFEYLAKARNGFNIVVISTGDNPLKMLLLVVGEDFVSTSKGTLYVSNPKFFRLLKKHILQGLRN